MERIAEFEKVSYEQFLMDAEELCKVKMGTWELSLAYRNYVRLPTRATKESAGYDITTPIPIILKPNEELLLPTGIRCQIDKSWTLDIYPRSSFGFKYRMLLVNTVGIVDSDYYNADNEGHILLKITVAHPMEIEAGTKIAQGIFHQFGITRSDNADGSRTGGFGSTGL